MPSFLPTTKLKKLRASKLEKQESALSRLSNYSGSDVLSPDDDASQGGKSLTLEEENALLDKELDELRKVRENLSSETGKKKKKKKKPSDDASAMESVGTPATKRKKKKSRPSSVSSAAGNEIVYDDDDDQTDVVDSLPISDTPRKKKKKKKSSDGSVVSEMTMGTTGTKKKKKKKKVSADGEDGDESTIATNKSGGTKKKKVRKSKSSRSSDVSAMTEFSADDNDRYSTRASERVSELGELKEGEEYDNAVPPTPGGTRKKKKKKKKLGDEESVGTMGTKGTKGTKKMRRKKKSETSASSDSGTLNDLIEGNTISFDPSEMDSLDPAERSLGMRGISERGERTFAPKARKTRSSSNVSTLREPIQEERPVKMKSKASGGAGVGPTNDDDSAYSELSMSTFDKAAVADVDDELKPIRRGRKSQVANQENTAEEKSSPIQPAGEVDAGTSQFFATFAFEGDTAGSQLSFPSGALITAKPNQDGAWWWGSYNGMQGWFPPTYVTEQQEQTTFVAEPETVIKESNHENDENPPVKLAAAIAVTEEIEEPAVVAETPVVVEEQEEDEEEQPHEEKILMEQDQSQDVDPTIASPIQIEDPIESIVQADPSDDSAHGGIASSDDGQDPATNDVRDCMDTTLDSGEPLVEPIAEPETLASADCIDAEVTEPVEASEPYHQDDSQIPEEAVEIGVAFEVEADSSRINVAPHDSDSEDEASPMDPAIESSEVNADAAGSDVIEDRDSPPLHDQEDETKSSSSESEGQAPMNPFNAAASKINHVAHDLKEKAEEIKENKPVLNAVRGAVEDLKEKQPIKTAVQGLVEDMKEKKPLESMFHEAGEIVAGIEEKVGDALGESEPAELEEEVMSEAELVQLESPVISDEESESSEETVQEEVDEKTMDPEELKKMVAAEKERVELLLEELVQRERENAAEKLELQTENESLSKEKEFLELQTENLKQENEQMDRAIFFTEYQLEDLRDNDEAEHDEMMLDLEDENDALKEQLAVYTNFIRKLREDEYDRLQQVKYRMIEILEEGEDDNSEMDDTIGPARDINLEEKEEVSVASGRIKVRGELLKVSANLKESNLVIEHNRMAIEQLKAKLEETRKDNSVQTAMEEVNGMKDDVKIALLTAMHEKEELQRKIDKEDAAIKEMEAEIAKLSTKQTSIWGWIAGAEESESESEEDTDEEGEEDDNVDALLLSPEESVRKTGDAMMQQKLRESRLLLQF